MRFIIIIFFLFFCSFIKGFSQDEFRAGLYFASNEVVQDQRTSLDLTPDQPLKIKERFKIEFDIKLRKGDGYYGYIFRIIANGENNIDLISNFASRNENFSLVFRDEILCSYQWKDLPTLDYDKWTHISFELDLVGGQVALSIDGVLKQATIQFPESKADFDFLFGISKHHPFQSTDVCPMSLRNILILDQHYQPIRNWKLAKHNNNAVYDEIEHAKAVVENASWIIDHHLKWTAVTDLQIPELLGATKDEESGRLFFISKQAVYVWSLNDQSLDTIEVKGGQPFELPDQVIYNPYTHEIWSYNFNADQINRFNFDTQTWSVENPIQDDPGFAHHNIFLNPQDSSLTAILGYGYYRYKSVVNHFDPEKGQWSQLARNDQIDPRYLSGAGLLNKKTMLVFGGYGSKTGRQELSPGYYYDLFEFSLKDYSFHKKWTLPTPESPFVPCDQLIITADQSSFYTLVYNNLSFNTYLKLARFDVQDAGYQLYNDSIPYHFLDIDSWCSVIHDKANAELVAITTHNNDVSIYKIAYPPLNPSDVYQKEEVQNIFKRMSWLGELLILVLIGVLVFFLLRRTKTKKVRFSTAKFGNPEVQNSDEISRPHIAAIHFLGGFQIYDRLGSDITSGFSPTLKQLFLIIFFHTIQHEKGISSLKLDETLWYDKQGKSARNNRNVNISKLRAAVETVGEIEIVSENSCWKLKIGSSIYCDYLDVMKLVKKSRKSELDTDEINRLVSLLSFGELLPNMQVDWMDSFKASFTNEVLDCLVKLIYRDDLVSDNHICIHLANSIFTLDPINEIALSIKCKILYQTGKGGMAKSRYATFCKEYERLLNTEYPVSFSDVISE